VTSSNCEHQAIADWFIAWDTLVRDVNYIDARKLFHEDVIGFGTHMEVVRGLEQLEARQWRTIWPTIEDFTFIIDQLVTGVSNDGLQAWGIVPWSSFGFHEDGTRFPRPGRATVLFTRASTSEPWRAIHTHISLSPGTPQKSHGNRPEAIPSQG
jgi:ketosteroid isomerase-like protein